MSTSPASGPERQETTADPHGQGRSLSGPVPLGGSLNWAQVFGFRILLLAIVAFILVQGGRAPGLLSGIHPAVGILIAVAAVTALYTGALYFTGPRGLNYDPSTNQLRRGRKTFAPQEVKQIRLRLETTPANEMARLQFRSSRRKMTVFLKVAGRHSLSNTAGWGLQRFLQHIPTAPSGYNATAQPGHIANAQPGHTYTVQQRAIADLGQSGNRWKETTADVAAHLLPSFVPNMDRDESVPSKHQPSLKLPTEVNYTQPEPQQQPSGEGFSEPTSHHTSREPITSEAIASEPLITSGPAGSVQRTTDNPPEQPLPAATAEWEMQLIQDDYAAQEFLERHPAPNKRSTGRVLHTVVFLAALGCLITSITLDYSPVWAATAGALAVVWIPAFIVTQHARNTHLLALRHHALWWLRHRDAAQIQRGVPASLLTAWGRARFTAGGSTSSCSGSHLWRQP